MVVAVALTEPAGVESVLTVTVVLAQPVVLQVPIALTKYVVVLDGDTLIEFPVPTNVPPQLPLYQFHVAPVPKLPPVTVRVVDDPLQMVVMPEIPVGATDNDCTVIVTGVQVVFPQAFSPRTQYVVVDAGLTVMLVLLYCKNVLPVYQAQLPALPVVPLNLVNVTEVPAHTVVEGDAVTEVAAI